jgi:hypothetical protein
MKRQEATALNLLRYNTGKPCKHGHLSDRFTSNGACIGCIDKWKSENPDKVEKIKQVSNGRYFSSNREKVLEKHREWHRKNPSKRLALENKRRAAKLQRTVPWLNAGHKFEIDCVYKYCSALRMAGLKFEVDHIVPLQGELVSGLHAPWNLQVIHEFDNRSKGAKYDRV